MYCIKTKYTLGGREGLANIMQTERSTLVVAYNCSILEV